MLRDCLLFFASSIHSLLGEAQDHLSEASVTDLNKAVDDAKNKSRNSGESSPVSTLLNLLAKVPGESNVSRDVEDVSRGPETDPADMTPQEMYKKIWAILSLRDRIMKSVELTIEVRTLVTCLCASAKPLQNIASSSILCSPLSQRIPGLSSLVESVTNAINVWVFTLIEPYVKPIMQQAMGGLHQGSSMVINKEDQFEVFDNPNASDPTHSMLSKDHFGLILNEVAGNIATIIVRHTVTNVVKAWDDTSLSAEQVADEVSCAARSSDSRSPRVLLFGLYRWSS